MWVEKEKSCSRRRLLVNVEFDFAAMRQEGAESEIDTSLVFFNGIVYTILGIMFLYRELNSDKITKKCIFVLFNYQILTHIHHGL